MAENKVDPYMELLIRIDERTKEIKEYMKKKDIEDEKRDQKIESLNKWRWATGGSLGLAIWSAIKSIGG